MIFLLAFLVCSCYDVKSIEYSIEGKTSTIVTEKEEKKLFYEEKGGIKYPARGLIIKENLKQENLYSFYDKTIQQIKLDGKTYKETFDFLKIARNINKIILTKEGALELKGSRLSYKIDSYKENAFFHKEEKVLVVTFELSKDVAEVEGYFWVKAKIVDSNGNFILTNYLKFPVLMKDKWNKILPGEDQFIYPNEILLLFDDEKVKREGGIDPEAKVRLKISNGYAELWKERKEISRVALEFKEEDYTFLSLTNEEKDAIKKLG